MHYKPLFKAMMILVGLVATVVILLSQALPEISGEVAEKVKTEQTDKSHEGHTIAVPPSDGFPVVAVQINDVDRALLVTLEAEEKEVPTVQCISNSISAYFHVLFRAIISPNAP